MQSITYDVKCKNMNLSQNSMTNSFYATTLVFFFTPRKEKTSTAVIYLFKVNNRNTRTIYEIWSKLTIKTPQWSQWRHLVPLLLTLNIFYTLRCYFYCWLWTSECQLGVTWNGWRSLYLNFYKQIMSHFPISLRVCLLRKLPMSCLNTYLTYL